MILWVSHKALGTPNNQRVEYITTHKGRLVVEMCGTGAIKDIGPNDIISVEINDEITLHVRNPALEKKASSAPEQ